MSHDAGRLGNAYVLGARDRSSVGVSDGYLYGAIVVMIGLCVVVSLMEHVIGMVL